MLLFLAACATDGVPDDAPTFHQDVGPLLTEHCGGCHQPGGIGPFVFDTAEDAAALSELILNATTSRRMPPWPARETETCAPPSPWVDDLRLTEAEITTLRAWHLAGAPAGEPVPLDPPTDLTALPEPSVMLVPPTAVTISGVEDQYLCRSFDPQLDETVWATGLQVVPGDPAVVHHALVFADPTGASADRGDEVWPCFGGSGVPGTDLLQPWAPGQLPYELPPNAGFRLDPGSRFVVSVHYHPVPGEVHEDATGLEIRWTREQPELPAFVSLFGNRRGLQPGPADRTSEPEFFIPAGARAHTETFHLELEPGSPTFRIFSIGGHLHWVGTGIDVRLERSEGDDCLIDIPEWDFDWQLLYRYDAPLGDLPTISPGDRLVVRCTYDNSLDNPEVAALLGEQGLTEPIDVTLGEQTTDEMCLVMLGVVPAR
ncbi:MAG: hypothetical protein AAF602_12400 [Myxococcota bacterium]